jgi:hypothetical protein
MENVVEKVCHLCVVREVDGIDNCIKLLKRQATDPVVIIPALTLLIFSDSICGRTQSDQPLVLRRYPGSECHNVQRYWSDNGHVRY